MERMKRRGIYAQWDVLMRHANTPEKKRRAFAMLEQATRASLEAERHVATVFDDIRSALRERGFPTVLVPLALSAEDRGGSLAERQSIFEAWGL